MFRISDFYLTIKYPLTARQKIKVDTVFAALEKKNPNHLMAKVVRATPGNDDGKKIITAGDYNVILKSFLSHFNLTIIDSFYK